jgi:ADP-ribose pyrophosphatase YjhB (NUDIX family)
LALKFCSECGGRLQPQYVQSEGKERLVCQGCGRISYQDPKVSAGTVPVIGGRVLLARRAIEPGRGLWVFPGGYMERGETVPQAAERETFEEVRLRVRATRPLGVYSYPTATVVVVVYHCDVLGGEPEAGSETLEVRLFGRDEIPWAELAFPSTRDALRDLMAHWQDGV